MSFIEAGQENYSVESNIKFSFPESNLLHYQLNLASNFL